MRRELEAELLAAYSSFFPNMYNDSDKTCLSEGIQTGDGWFGLIKNLCFNIQEIIDEDDLLKDFYFIQIKEKFGLLRIHFKGGNKEISQLISILSVASGYVCENCGTTLNDVCTKGSYLKTLCKPCRKKS